MTKTDPAERLAALDRLADGLTLPGQSDVLYRATGDALQAVIGHRLLTLMIFDQETYEAERVHSDNTRAYPVGGRKQLARSPWGAHVIDGRSDWLGRTPEDIEWAFPDHEVIVALDLGSAINWVVMHDGRLLGTVNVLHESGYYDARHVETGRPFAALLAPAYLAHFG